MVPLLLRLIALVGAGILGYELFKKKPKEKGFSITRASNCHESFLTFNQNLNIPSTKRQLLIRSRQAIENKLKDYFKSKGTSEVPMTWIQGSYKLGTIIRTKHDTCDIDMGMYFFVQPNVEPRTLLQNVNRALNDHTTGSISIRRKCVRVNYAGDFHIDIPVYYRDQIKNKQWLATKEYGWEESDPKLFWEWFKHKTTSKPQLVRVIRYAKAWLNNYAVKTGRKAPSGLALTIWYIKNFVPHQRDDASFFYSSLRLMGQLSGHVGSWDCRMPVKPQDDLIIRVDEYQRRNFKEDLKQMLNDATRAVVANSKTEASEIWKSIFGKWFPE
jgi:hypothetical protein